MTITTGHPNPREVEALHLQDGAAAADPKRRVDHGAQEDEGGAPVLEIKTRVKEEGDVQNLKKMIQQVSSNYSQVTFTLPDSRTRNFSS